MLNIMSLLPLLKGWDYKLNYWTRTIKRGETLEVQRIEDMGVLLTMNLVTDDCYGGVTFAGQGAGLNTIQLANLYPKLVYDIGSFQQDPSGWTQLYYRPNPQSSLGAYYVTITSLGFQGSSIPYAPTTIIKLFLLKNSTQTEATISAATFRLIITDKKQFIKSLRAVIGMPTIQDIDSALLITGMQEITQKGEFDKGDKK